MNDILKGKKIVILGVANDRSIAWGIAKELKSAGAHIALTYLNDALKKRVEPLAKELDADILLEFDATREEDYDKLHQELKNHWGSVDVVVHSLAFAAREDLKGRFHETSRAGLSLACDISAFSLVRLTQALKPILSDEASIFTMTYHGAVKVVENYNVMGVAKAALEASMRYLADDLGCEGIRVNAISAGPIKTLSASGISGFRGILSTVEEKAPLRKNITPEDVGRTALYLASNLSSGVTGQVLYVDSGHSILGAS